MTYMQRLVRDRTVGFNYDHMGYVEFEHGATLVGRKAIAQGLVEKTMMAKDLDVLFYNTMHSGKRNYQQPIRCTIIAPHAVLQSTDSELHVQWQKTGPRIENPGIVGWMSVWWEDQKPNPMIILREDLDDKQKRINQFFGPIMEDLLKEKTV